jgi:hypothetical protein
LGKKKEERREGRAGVLKKESDGQESRATEREREREREKILIKKS